jgi:hypothetical protein
MVNCSVPPTLSPINLQAVLQDSPVHSIYLSLSFFLSFFRSPSGFDVPGHADETRDQKGNGAPAAKDAQPWLKQSHQATCS